MQRVILIRSVYIVDDDFDVRTSITFMLASEELNPVPLSGGEELLERLADFEPGCILLDVRMPNMDGFAVMAQLKQLGNNWPIIVMTGHGDVPVAVRAMKNGAIDFIEKPFGDDVLVSCLKRGFQLLETEAARIRQVSSARTRIAQLSNREREVLQGLLAGLPNKRLAQTMGISLRTVEMHRANMMNRLDVNTLAEALTLAVQADLQAVGAESAKRR